MDMTNQAMVAGNMAPQQQNTLLVRFYTKPRQDDIESALQGRPIFKDTPYIEIHKPGNKSSVIIRPVRDTDGQKYPTQWAAFKNGESQEDVGTPLAEWPQMSRSQVEELRFFNIRTVEHLANMADVDAQKFMGINSLKQKAKDFLAHSKSEVPLQQLRAENEALKGKMEDMQSQIMELMDANRKPAAPARRSHHAKKTG